MKHKTIASPFGLLYLSANSTAVTGLSFHPPRGQRSKESASSKEDNNMLKKASSQLKLYFRGNTRALEHLPVAQNGTDFQRAVWKAMRKVKPGTTITYQQLARKIGRPQAARAVGTACAKNPVGIIVPCHRVLASGGKLGGYSGGITKKRGLLAHEGALSKEASEAARDGGRE